MAEVLPFRLHLTGDTADQHNLQGYDGYMSLAGFALTLSLIANYAETGEIRHRGDFPGRHAVRAFPPEEASFAADFKVWLNRNPSQVLGFPNVPAGPNFFYELVRRMIDRNLGQESKISSPLLEKLIERKDGDLEALVARTEAPIKQSHDVIGNGALNMDILGGYNVLGQFNSETKEYVKSRIEDTEVITRDFTVNAFSANQGTGGLFDRKLNRSVSFSMSKEVLATCGVIFSWGLDEYTRRTGGTIRVTFNRILAMDGTAKKYIVHSASKTPEKSGN